MAGPCRNPEESSTSKSDIDMADDNISIEILKDGSLKITTDKISGPNHVRAESLIRELIELSGGKADKKHRHGFSLFGVSVTHEHKH